MAEFKILSRETIYQGRVFDIQKVKSLLPDGREHTFDLVAHAPAVTVLPLTAEGEIMLVSQFRLGSESDLLELPAGMMDPGEEPAFSARRELREETGMDCEDLIYLGGFYLAAGYSSEYMHCFLAKGLFPAPLEQDEDEFLSLTRIKVAELARMAQEGELQDSKTLAILPLAWPYLAEFMG